MSLKERLNFDKDPVFLVDGSAFVFRAFYAFPDLKRSDGFPTNALFIVLRVLLKILREERPAYLGFFLDGKGPTFRHEMFEPYKAQREATPEPLIQQLAPIRQAMDVLGLTVETSHGQEADDLIASLAHRFKGERPVVIVGADKDLKQCLDSNVVIWDPAGKKEKITTLEDFRKDTGLEPSQWPDFQAIIGDSSDNIPGVRGVGPKTAEKIFEQFDSLEAIMDGLDQLKPNLQKKIADCLDELPLYKKLTTLLTDAIPDLGLDHFKTRNPNPEEVVAFLQEYEFHSMIRELHFEGQSAAEVAAEVKPRKKITVKAIAAAKDLPDLADKELGLAPEQAKDAFRLGLSGSDGTDEQELRFGGGTADLIALAALPDLGKQLQPARTVFCPSIKELYGSLLDLKKPMDRDKWFDIGLAAYLLNPEERDYSFEHLRTRFSQDLELRPEAPGLDALALGRECRKQLHDAGLEELLRDLETPLIPVLTRMEQRGFAIDLQAFDQFLLEVRTEIESISKRIYKVAGGPFNIRSSQQLAELLFDRLELKPAGKTPGGSTSTSQAVLEKLQGAHPVIDDILDFRKLEKLRSTYLEPFPKLVDKNGRVHTTFNQMATATGRLSSSNPNLQNIPIRGDGGKRMRSCFVAAPGKLLVAADYSQIELRVLAHLTQDPTLVEAFQNNQDIHSRTAGLLFDKAPEEITPDERRNAKTINFGLIYGMGPQKLARDLQITLKEAKEFIERYFSRLQKVKSFYESVEEQAREQGYMTTLAGRRRLLPDIHSHNQQLQSAARRQAVNTLIQGSAADIIKIAMLQVDADDVLQSLGAHIILQVHDELILETPPDTAEQAGQRLAALMSDVRPGGQALSVPLAVDWGTGQNWGQAH